MKRVPYRTSVPRLYRAVIATLRPPIKALTSQVWSGGEHFPTSGGFIVATNHVSEIDPFMFAHYLVDHGYPPVFLAKESLFRIPVVGGLLPKLGQVPVHRGSAQAGDSLVAAEQALRRGQVVAIMPEGTLTRDPELWPMRARSGVGRLALRTRVPVIPVAQWGPQDLLAPYARRPTGLFARLPMTMKAGPAVPLEDLYDQADRPVAHRAATDRVMAAITELLGQIRGETPPTQPFDPRHGTR